MKKNQSFRIEKDSLGEVKVPKKALWGAQTQRAIENFPISGIKFKFPFGRSFIKSLGLIKYSAAVANQDLGNLIDKIIPNCGIKCQGLIFYPKYSGINIVYVDKQQEKIEISVKGKSHSEIDPKSYDLISNMVNYLKQRSYSYEKTGKIRKLWLKNTDIPDVYNIYEKDNCDNKLGIAHIPNLKTSHMCNNNISDSDIKCFECIYNNNFKKWIPLNPI